MLPDEMTGLTGGLDRCRIDRRDSSAELFLRRADRDEADVAEKDKCGGGVGFLLENVTVFGGSGGVFDWPVLERCAVAEINSVFLLMSRVAWPARIGAHVKKNVRLIPDYSGTGSRSPGYT